MGKLPLEMNFAPTGMLESAVLNTIGVMALPLLEIRRNEEASVDSLGPTAPGSRQPYALSLAVFLAVLLFFSLPLSAIPFSSHGEAREAVVVQNMTQQQNYILPLRNGVDIPSKPPGFHWIALATSFVTGEVSEFSVRFPSALTSACAVAVTFLVITMLLDISAATLVVLILCTSFEWMRSSSLGRVDMVFSLFTGLALLLVYRVLSTKHTIKQLLFLIVGLAVTLAAAALTKGPAGLAIPLIVGSVMVVLCGYVEKNSFSKIYWHTLLLLGLAGIIALILSSIWYYQAYQIGGEEFLRVQIMRENVARLLGTESYEAETGHHAPFYYGVVLLFAGLLPWSFLLPVVAVMLWIRRREILRPENKPVLFALLWCAVFFGIITVSGSKRTVYFLPAYPPTVFLLVWTLQNGARSRWARNIARALIELVAITLCLTALVVAVGWGMKTSLPSILPLSDRSQHEFEIVWRVLTESISTLGIIITASIVALFAIREERRRTQLGLCLTALSLLLVVYEINSVVYPALAAEKSPRALMSQVTAKVPPDTPIFQYRDNLYTSMFYAKRTLRFTSSLAVVRTHPLAYVLVEKKYLPEVQIALPNSAVEIESSGKVSDGRDALVLLRYTAPEPPP